MSLRAACATPTGTAIAWSRGGTRVEREFAFAAMTSPAAALSGVASVGGANAPLPWHDVAVDARPGTSLHRPVLSATFAAVRGALQRKEALSRPEALAHLRDVERLVAWADAARAELVVAAVGLQPEPLATTPVISGRGVRDVAACEMGAVLGISAGAAMNLAEESRALVLWLPNTLQLLRAGMVTRYRARIVAEGAQSLFAHLDDDDPQAPGVIDAMRQFESLVVRRIQTTGYLQLRRTVQLAIARIVPAAVALRHERAREQRRVDLFDQGSGMSLLQAMLPSLDAARVWQVLEHAATSQRDVPGSLTTRMADALVAIVDGSTELPAHVRNQAAEVQVVVSLETLLGMTQDAAEIRGSEGLLSADLVRELAVTSPLRRLVVAGLDGRLLDFGRSTYRPPAALRDHIQARDQQCRAPGCNRPARYCDIDHILGWDDGGTTDVGNLATLCRRHHLLKTFAGWDYRLDPDSTAVWRLPGGDVMSDPPTPVLALGAAEPPF